jgi:flavin-dependent dehydrogenase
MSTPESRARARRAGAEAITIIGAGPAGLACAIALARGGRRVAVREWHRDVGARFRGDFQGLENWSDDEDVLSEVEKAGIQITFEHHAVSHGTAYDSLGNQYTIRSERPLFYLVRRGGEAGCFDHALLDQAAAAGVEVSFEDRASDVQGATILAVGPRLADAIAVGYVFETDMDDGNWLALDNRLAPLGYAYLLIHGGRGTVASCMFTGFKRQAAYVERTVAFFRERVGLKMHNSRPFGGFANFRLPRGAMQGGHPVIGEQAGFQDALAGFGMRYALRSGLIAARSIIQGADYTSLWRRELLPLLRTGIVNRFLFGLIGEPGWRLALRRLSRGDSRAALRRFYRPSILSRIVFPVARVCYRAPLRDQSCDHIACQCVWCQHQSELTAMELVCRGI